VPSFSYLRNEAHQIGQGSNDPTVAKLAKLVGQLCDKCDDLERETKKAYDEAKRAKRETRK